MGWNENDCMLTYKEAEERGFEIIEEAVIKKIIETAESYVRAVNSDSGNEPSLSVRLRAEYDLERAIYKLK